MPIGGCPRNSNANPLMKRMTESLLVRAVIVSAAFLTLGGCGLKDDLYRPADAPRTTGGGDVAAADDEETVSAESAAQ